MPNYSTGYPSPQHSDQFGYYGDPNQFQPPQQQQQQSPQQDPYAPNGNLPQFSQHFSAAFNNP